MMPAKPQPKRRRGRPMTAVGFRAALVALEWSPRDAAAQLEVREGVPASTADVAAWLSGAKPIPGRAASMVRAIWSLRQWAAHRNN